MPGTLRSWLRVILALAGLMILTSCGGAMSGQDGLNKAGPPGLYTDATLSEYLQVSFDEVQACSGLTEGSFADLTVVMMEPQFPCKWYEGGCSGEFVTPNTIKLGSPYVWKHEALHYLLYLNTGQSDSTHDSTLFWDCV
jgi:hypothetical protein